MVHGRFKETILAVCNPDIRELIEQMEILFEILHEFYMIS